MFPLFLTDEICLRFRVLTLLYFNKQRSLTASYCNTSLLYITRCYFFLINPAFVFDLIGESKVRQALASRATRFISGSGLFEQRKDKRKQTKARRAGMLGIRLIDKYVSRYRRIGRSVLEVRESKSQE